MFVVRTVLIASVTMLLVCGLVLNAQAGGSIPGDQSVHDGSYSAHLPFKMGGSSVCPSLLPIEIVFDVVDGKLTGYEFNNVC